MKNTAARHTDARIKVLVVDDSRTVCRFLEATFSEDPSLEVVGMAHDPFEARDLIKKVRPDVITLDVEMPRMDGVTFLKNLMRTDPIPVVMFSSWTSVGATATIDALQAGAVDFMPKHSARSAVSLEDYISELIMKVKSAATVNLRSESKLATVGEVPDLTRCSEKLDRAQNVSATINKLIAIGASTGGPEALGVFLKGFEDRSSVLVVAQHMPANFIESFAKRLDELSILDVRVAQHGDRLAAGQVYLSPGDQHLKLFADGDGYQWRLWGGDPVNGHRPSIDLLFESVAQYAPHCSVGVLMTGMGEDGAAGLKAMKEGGALTMIQDEASSAVWGMPGKAFSTNAHDFDIHLHLLAPALNKLLK
ncbi:MAG: chemotaxis response regulator protein-glutamate methylesterase [Granulosicoccus sp.]